MANIAQRLMDERSAAHMEQIQEREDSREPPSLTPTERRRVAASESAAAATRRERILMGNGYDAWWVPRREMFSVTAGTLRERAEAAGWEKFSPFESK